MSLSPRWQQGEGPSYSIPCSASQRSASRAAMHPVPAAVTDADLEIFWEAMNLLESDFFERVVIGRGCASFDRAGFADDITSGISNRTGQDRQIANIFGHMVVFFIHGHIFFNLDLHLVSAHILHA